MEDIWEWVHLTSGTYHIINQKKLMNPWVFHMAGLHRPMDRCKGGEKDWRFVVPTSTSNTGTIGKHWTWLGSKCVCACVFSHRQLFVTPWTIAQQAPLSVGFPRQEYWSGLPFPPPGDLLHPGIEFMPPVSPTLAGRFFTSWAIREALTKSPKHIPLVFCLSKLSQWPLSTYQ